MDHITHFKIKRMSPQLLVADVDRSVEFYTKELDFDVDFRYEDFYAGIIKDGCSIHLKEGSPSVNEGMRKGDDEHFDIVFSVEGIDDLYKEISRRSVEIVQPLRSMPYGKEFYFADPDGHVIAFLET
ncbi:VOC family protein [Chryseolinea sp. T2]|uniref:VOC family protein n=1 Tax=Chryseolinea sp. T2 TaxID=3129255 RepID=UPI003077B753